MELLTLFDAFGGLDALTRSDTALPIPEYEVHVSPRARRVRLRVLPGRPVIVTLPRGVPRTVAEGFVRESAEWIERARGRVEAAEAALESKRAEPLPAVVPLPGVGLRYIVERRPGGGAGVRASERAGRVILAGAVDDDAACRAALGRWARRVAVRELPALAARLGETTGLEPRSVTVTWPRSRWGSCSPGGDVRLSVDLLFLPEELARAVVLHELAHLRVLDHSPRFWKELALYDPLCREHRAELGRARDHLPGWALPER